MRGLAADRGRRYLTVRPACWRLHRTRFRPRPPPQKASGGAALVVALSACDDVDDQADARFDAIRR